MSKLAKLLQAAAGAGGASGPTEIGEEYGGGYYAGNIIIGVTEYYLIVAPKSTGQGSYQWKTVRSSSSGTTSTFNGAANTAAMVSLGSHPAASFCAGLTIGDYTDWYMPSRYEMEICYYNLKPSTNPNNTGYGTNPYAVPARTSNYTWSDPAQTSVTLFQSGGSEAYDTSTYWVSTEASAGNAELIVMGEGQILNNDKDGTRRVRAVRKEAV